MARRGKPHGPGRPWQSMDCWKYSTERQAMSNMDETPQSQSNTRYQVNYSGQWEDTDTKRAERILNDHYRDFDTDIKPLMQAGQEIRTKFASYRIDLRGPADEPDYEPPDDHAPDVMLEAEERAGREDMRCPV